MYIFRFLDSKPKRQYNMPVTSGSAYVGQLFDAKQGELLHDKFLWKTPVGVNEAMVTHVQTETYIDETIKDRLYHMGFSASISATLFSFITVSTFLSPKFSILFLTENRNFLHSFQKLKNKIGNL